MNEFKIGDIIERCSLMPAIIQKIEGDNIEAYDFGYVSKDYNGHSCCSKTHCGIIKITPEFALILLALGKDRLSEIYKSLDEITDASVDMGIIYHDKVKEEYNKLIFENGKN